MITNNKTVSTVSEFDIIDNNFINFYSKDNPILSIGDRCYFIFNNLVDVHIPLIGYGEVIMDKFITGMDKNYQIKLFKIHSPVDIQDEFIFNNQPFRVMVKDKPKIMKFNKSNIINTVFNVHCFFCRPTLSTITQFHKKYCGVIIDDLHKQLKEVKSFYP